ncbi:MAG: iron-containing alcohol dehydrogenase, partial [Syntrophomonadaceae bacterium]|nr:iron-containing alcohol dehydrogenase [Syntrophomonadaceae bacterium]
AVNDGKNLEARTKMLVASNMAIMAFSMSGLFYPVHNVAHAVGGQLRIAHGEANAVLIPILMDKFPKHYLNSAEVLADAFGFHSQGKTAEEIVSTAAERVRDLQKKCGVNEKFNQPIDDTTRELMYWAVKFDPSGLFYPLTDVVIRETLAAAF